MFEQLARKYPRAIFLKVDVDKCQETAASQGVTAMPTFIFYRNKVRLNVNHQYQPVYISLFMVCTKLLGLNLLISDESGSDPRGRSHIPGEQNSAVLWQRGFRGWR